MSALKWLDAVRADLDVIERPWSFEPASAGWTLEDAGYVFGIVSNVNSAVLIASAPDRLDKMERALRGALERHSRSHRCGRTGHTEGIECIHCETVCSACDEAWPCPTVATIQEALG